MLYDIVHFGLLKYFCLSTFLVHYDVKLRGLVRVCTVIPCTEIIIVINKRVNIEKRDRIKGEKY